MKSLAIIFDKDNTILKRAEIETIIEAFEAANELDDSCKLTVMTKIVSSFFANNFIVSREFKRCEGTQDWYCVEDELVTGNEDFYVSSESEDDPMPPPPPLLRRQNTSASDEDNRLPRPRGMF